MLPGTEHHEPYYGHQFDSQEYSYAAIQNIKFQFKSDKLLTTTDDENFEKDKNVFVKQIEAKLNEAVKIQKMKDRHEIKYNIYRVFSKDGKGIGPEEL